MLFLNIAYSFYIVIFFFRFKLDFESQWLQTFEHCKCIQYIKTEQLSYCIARPLATAQSG